MQATSVETSTEQAAATGTAGAPGLVSKSVTTLVGLRQPGYALVASDSRSTVAFGGMAVALPRDGRKKLHLVGNALVGLAGDDELCDRWLELLVSEATSLVSRPYELLAAVGDIRKTVSAERGCPATQVVASAFTALRSDRAFELLACDAADAVTVKPCDIAVNTPTAPGTFELRLRLGDRPSAGRAISASTWLIRETASADLGVGGPVQVGLVDASGARLVPPDLIAEMDARMCTASGVLATTLTETATLFGA